MQSSESAGEEDGGRFGSGSRAFRLLFLLVLPLCLAFADVVPTPPDGPPTIATVTGRAVTLQWNKPKWLDPTIGKQGPDGRCVCLRAKGRKRGPWERAVGRCVPKVVL